jgi:hypothetical protein
MGEDKRKRVMRAMMQGVVDGLWEALAEPERKGLPLTRVDLLALLFEKAMLLKGLSEPEADRLIEILEEVDRRATEAGMLRPDVEREREHFPAPKFPPPPPPKRGPPIDPERMRQIEERGRYIAAFVGNAAKDLGWVVLLFELGDRPELTYLSSCNRDDIVAMLDGFRGVLTQRRDFPPGVLTQKPN